MDQIMMPSAGPNFSLCTLNSTFNVNQLRRIDFEQSKRFDDYPSTRIRETSALPLSLSYSFTRRLRGVFIVDGNKTQTRVVCELCVTPLSSQRETLHALVCGL